MFQYAPQPSSSGGRPACSLRHVHMTGVVVVLEDAKVTDLRNIPVGTGKSISSLHRGQIPASRRPRRVSLTLHVAAKVSAYVVSVISSNETGMAFWPVIRSPQR